MKAPRGPLVGPRSAEIASRVLRVTPNPENAIIPPVAKEINL